MNDTASKPFHPHPGKRGRPMRTTEEAFPTDGVLCVEGTGGGANCPCRACAGSDAAADKNTLDQNKRMGHKAKGFFHSFGVNDGMKNYDVEVVQKIVYVIHVRAETESEAEKMVVNGMESRDLRLRGECGDGLDEWGDSEIESVKVKK